MEEANETYNEAKIVAKGWREELLVSSVYKRAHAWFRVHN